MRGGCRETGEGRWRVLGLDLELLLVLGRSDDGSCGLGC